MHGYRFVENELGQQILILPDGKRLRTEAIRNGKEIWIDLAGRSFKLVKHDWVGDESADAAIESGDVLAPMTGKITALHVGAGDLVKAGDVLSEMEAMKMQYSLKAPISGKVVEVNAGVGDVVELDAVLLRIEGEA